jgi:8-oxo-dGTP pyrophosphatase MutT (NUDIX family)
MEPKFNNRPNEELKLQDRIVWLSRSVAIVGIVLGKFMGDTYVLIEERSQTMMDQPGKWCLPCGYIDWDENGLQAITRELYEETSLYLPKYNRFLVNANKCEPFRVNTEATENRQNIVLYFGFVYDFNKEGLPLEPLSHIDHEISDVRWVKLNEVNDYSLVFGHDLRIVQAEEYFYKSLLPWWKRWIKKLFC